MKIKLKSGSTVELNDDDATHTWARLARLNLVGAVFPPGYKYDGQCFSGLDLRSAVMSRVSFVGADFTGAILGEEKVPGAICAETNFSKANFTRAVLQRCDFDSAILREATLREASLVSAHFLRGADLSGADITDTQWTDATLSGACLRGAAGCAVFGRHVEGCTFDHAMLDGSSFYRSNCTGSTFRNTSLKRVQFKEANLTNVDFSGSDLTDAEFNFSCTITGIKLAGAKNVPELHGVLAEIPVLLRRAGPKVPPRLQPYMTQAISKLWLDHMLSGGDILLQPIDEVIDAALALAELYATEKKR